MEISLRIVFLRSGVHFGSLYYFPALFTIYIMVVNKKRREIERRGEICKKNEEKKIAYKHTYFTSIQHENVTPMFIFNLSSMTSIQLKPMRSLKLFLVSNKLALC